MTERRRIGERQFAVAVLERKELVYKEEKEMFSTTFSIPVLYYCQHRR